MNVISYKSLREFCDDHHSAKGAMVAWYKDVSSAKWNNWAELKAQYQSADAVGDDRVVFDIVEDSLLVAGNIKSDTIISNCIRG
eukprot:gene16186-21450_t